MPNSWHFSVIIKRWIESTETVKKKRAILTLYNAQKSSLNARDEKIIKKYLHNQK